MQNIKKYNIIAILTISVVAGIFNNIPLSYAQDNSTMTNTPMTNLTQTEEEEEEEYTTTEAGHSAEEEEKEHNETSTVRDSVTELLDSQIIPGGDFIHLYDTTPYHILNGHVALKAPCEDDSITPIQILIGSAPNMTAACNYTEYFLYSTALINIVDKKMNSSNKKFKCPHSQINFPL